MREVRELEIAGDVRERRARGEESSPCSASPCLKPKLPGRYAECAPKAARDCRGGKVSRRSKLPKRQGGFARHRDSELRWPVERVPLANNLKKARELLGCLEGIL